MSSTSTSVCNMALSHLGSGLSVADITTDNTPESKACRQFLEDALNSTLRDFKWPWAKKYADLGLVEEDPTNGWGFSYRYPADCLDVRGVESSFDLTPGVVIQKPSPYELGFDSEGLLIFSDIEDAMIFYTPKITNYGIFPSNFILALSFRLAAYIAPRVTKGDPFKLGMKSLQMYQMEIGKASANSFNETKPAATADPEMISVRN